MWKLPRSSSTRFTSRKILHWVRDVLDGDRNDDRVQRAVAEGQAAHGVDVRHQAVVELRVLGKLHGVEAQANEPLPRKVLRKMRPPATHQVEDDAFRREARAEVLADGLYGLVVDVNDQAGLPVEEDVGDSSSRRKSSGRNGLSGPVVMVRSMLPY